MTPLIINKIPHDMKRKYIQNSKGSDWTMPTFIDFLNEEVKVNKQCDNLVNISGNSSQSSRFEQYCVNSNIHRQISETKFTKPSDDNKTTTLFTLNTNKIQCSYCQGIHRSKDCEKYSNIKARKSRIKELHLCYRCLEKITLVGTVLEYAVTARTTIIFHYVTNFITRSRQQTSLIPLQFFQQTQAINRYYSKQLRLN